MAYTIENFEVGLDKSLSYNIDHAVGATSGSNWESDVMLVQALLRIFFYEGSRRAGENEPPAGHKGLTVDGKCGPTTQAHIRQFKEYMRKKGMPTLADGKIDPAEVRADGGWAGTKIRDDFYVIDVLNMTTKSLAKLDNRPELYDLRSRTEDIPLPLRSALQRRVLTI